MLVRLYALHLPNHQVSEQTRLRFRVVKLKIKMKRTCLIIGLLFAIAFTGCASRREAQREIDLTYDKRIPQGTWAAGQVYAIAKRAEIYSTGTKWYLTDPHKANGELMGVVELGERLRVIKIYTLRGGFGTVRVEAVFETGRFTGKKVEIDGFGAKDSIFENYGTLHPPDPKYLRRIR